MLYLSHVAFLILLSVLPLCVQKSRCNGKRCRWVDDLVFVVLFNSISVIIGQWAADYERLCAMESR